MLQQAAFYLNYKALPRVLMLCGWEQRKGEGRRGKAESPGAARLEKRRLEGGDEGESAPIDTQKRGRVRIALSPAVPLRDPAPSPPPAAAPAPHCPLVPPAALCCCRPATGPVSEPCWCCQALMGPRVPFVHSPRGSDRLVPHLVVPQPMPRTMRVENEIISELVF